MKKYLHKKLCLLFLALGFSFISFAASYPASGYSGEGSDNLTVSPMLGDSIPDDLGDPDMPIGDELLPLSLAIVAYGAYVVSKKKNKKK